MKNKLIVHNQKYVGLDKKGMKFYENTVNKMQDVYPGVLDGYDRGHTPESCCPLPGSLFLNSMSTIRFTLLISRKSEKSYA